MAVYKTDRQRRIVGDRIAARQGELAAIHPAVGEMHATFRGAHGAFASALEERRREEGEGGLAREKRDAAAARCAELYAWSYHQVDALLRPTWDAAGSAADPDAVRGRLFPLGNPTAVSLSAQLALDGVTHFLAAAARETAVTYPTPFLQAARTAKDALASAAAAVTREDDQGGSAAKAVAEARDRWDTCYVALRDVASGFLRLQGKHDRLDVLFRELDTAGTSAEETAEPPAAAATVTAS